MKRLGQLVIIAIAAAAALPEPASAQAPQKMAAQFTAGVTFGNQSSGSIGGEFDYKIGTEWEVFFEAGQMRNVAPGFIDDRAQIIASAIGASASVAQRATFYDAGVKYLFVPFGGGYQPYAGLGFGAAHVSNDVVFSVGGADLSEDQLLNQYGVQLGNDLAGGSTKPLFLVALGVSRDFARRYFLDLSYRYGLIFAKTDKIEDDEKTNTQRLQLGFGVRF
jgi:opacity protein-like surface antigen